MNKQSPYQKLCALALANKILAERFCQLLTECGLARSQACEIKVLLCFADLAQAFVDGRQTWTQAFAEARRRRRQ